MEDFYSVVEEAKKIEKNSLGHTVFNDEVLVQKDIDFSPQEFEDLGFNDILNLYERTEKIISTSKMQIFGAGSAPVEKETKLKRSEVENKVKAMTTETLESVEELSREFEKPIEVKAPAETAKPEKAASASVSSFDEISLLDIEKPSETTEPSSLFAREPAQKEEETAKKAAEKPSSESLGELEFELEKSSEKTIELEREIKKEPPSIPLEEKKKLPGLKSSRPEIEKLSKAPKIETPKEAPKVPLPSVLQQTADQAASEKFDDISEHFSREWGGAVDEVKIKKKMLELTKELFREKTVSRREKIKLEISVLKNMLVAVKSAPGKKPKTADLKAGYSSKLFETLQSTQKSELSANKDSVLSSYERQIDEVKKKFSTVLLSIGESDTEARKMAYEKFVFELTSLSEQLHAALSKNEAFVVQKHKSELAKLLESGEVKDKKLEEQIRKYAEAITEIYHKDFEKIESMIKKNIDTIIHTHARHAIPSAEVDEKEEKIEDLVNEINNTDEGTLLYYLHSRKPDIYKKYERNHISKHEAVQYAKILMSKDKGLSDVSITKYFGDISES